ncbi:hypothetical protein [Actinomycetospora termitidis]|uniref:Colicin V production protein n=1 Tax=Actinomycetospora termitidis TaxID=3053470 RepID=A0ABT7M8A3_9PSEU|nr:hypothetical protein [Actinomycetospora sp. Odt1-22]MDL5156686.1 hypothetical protein [Actinomycetospora sp. Odt1-22]
MTLVDLVVLAVVALAAWRGWRRGGTSLVLSVAGAVVGIVLGAAVAGWWDPSSRGWLIAAIVVGGLVGIGLGRKLADALATRGGGRVARPVLVDRAVGVVAHGGLALVVCVLIGAAAVAFGPAWLGRAAEDSGVLTTAQDHLPTVSQVTGSVPGLDRVAAVGR